MKRYMLMAALAAATVGLFTSCSEEEIVKVSAKTGEAIRFSATTRAAATRTVYSATATDGKWDLYWVNEDRVTVHCPQANVQDGRVNTAVYTVAGVDGTKNEYGITGEGLYWGAEDTHYFYEAYPSKNVQKIEGGVLTATMPETQTPTLENGYYVDMDAALMAGKTSCKKTDVESTGVNLPFEPLFTAVDITVSASTNQDFELHSISVGSVAEEKEGVIIQQPISGSFTYDYSGGYETLAGNNFVQMEFDTPIPLAKGSAQPIKATIFIRGDYDGAVRVMLNGKLDGEFTQLAKEGDPTVETHLLKPRMRNHIILGALPEKREDTPPVDDLTGSNWIAYEKNATFVSKMSIPGSYDSGNFVEGTSGTRRTQSNSIGGLETTWNGKENVPGSEVVNYQLNHGVRAFDMRMKWDASKGFYVNRRISISNPASYRNATVLRDFLGYAVSWLKAHTTEFLVVFLRADDTTADVENFNAHIYDEITNKIMTGDNKNYYLLNFPADITVKQARGKILFVLVNTEGDIVGNSLNTWNNETVGMQEATFKSAGNAFIHDWFGVSPGWRTNSWGIPYLVSGETRKKESLEAAFTACKGNNEISSWYITSTCCHTEGLIGAITGGSNISDQMDVYNQYVIDQAKACPSGQNLGIVLMGYVCTDDNNQKGQSAVNAVWQLNFK